MFRNCNYNVNDIRQIHRGPNEVMNMCMIKVICSVRVSSSNNTIPSRQIATVYLFVDIENFLTCEQSNGHYNEYFPGEKKKKTVMLLNLKVTTFFTTLQSLGHII